MIDGLVIFFKSPKLGEVKTRLASSVGDKKALEIYRVLVARTKAIVEEWQMNSPSHRRIIPWGSGDRQGFCDVGFDQAKQQLGSDLGVRMERSMREALRQCDRVAIIGVDCPRIEVSDLELAFKDMGNQEVRLGPCPDGGYWLMSCSSLPPGCLVQLPWSHSETRQRVASRLEGYGRKLSLLRELGDVDVEEDLKGLTIF